MAIPVTVAEPLSKARRWTVLTTTCLALLLVGIDMTVLHLAIPVLVTDLGPSATQILWIADAYGFAMGGLLVTMGNLGDRFGRKRMLLAGCVAFGLASLVTAYAADPGLLIASRALLGVAGAAMLPQTSSIVRNVFSDPKERTAAVGMCAGVSAAGFALGPIVGGALLNHFWWGSVFLVNVPVVALIFVMGLKVLPESRNPNPGRLDALSVGLSVVGVTAVIWALKEAVHSGVTQPAVMAAGAGGVGLLVWFARRQYRLKEPLIDIRLFHRRPFAASVGANFVSVFAMSAFSLIFAQYFQQVLGWSPLISGLATLPAGVAAIVAGVVAGGLVARFGRSRIVSAGLGLAAVGFAMFTMVGTSTTYLPLLLPMFLFNIGAGLTFAVTGDTILGTVPKERAGAASGISATSYEVGGSLGIAVLGSLLNGSFRSEVDGVESLGEALATGNASLIDAARHAYVHGVHVTVAVCAALIAVLAVTVLFTLRGVPKIIDEH